MKRYIALAVLVAGLLIAGLSNNADATTTYANGTASTDNSGATVTPVVSTNTAETEAAPSGATVGHTLVVGKYKDGLSTHQEVVVTVKAHIIVNASGDAGIYDQTDASALGTLNTFSPSAKLLMWVYDDANGNTTWTRYPAGDKTLTFNDATATISVKVADLPKVKRFALVPYKTNVPVKITYSER